MSGEIRLLTKRDRILSVADRWKAQYWSKEWDGTVKQEVLAALQSLDLSTATEDDIFVRVGNRSWTQIICDQCGESVEWAVLIGGSDEYGQDKICPRCLQKAVDVIRYADVE